jgi:hypothetical protein
MDYSALHPRLIYAERGIQYEGDPNAVGQLIIGISINVDGASLSRLSVYKNGGGVDDALWGQTALSKAGIRTIPNTRSRRHDFS